MAYETIIYEKKDRIGYVTLNRPERLNATDYAMHEELYDVWQTIMKDDDVWVVVLTGKGRAFQTGADMKEAASGERTREHSGFPDPVEMNKPIVCAVNGICAGGGLILLGRCDVIICSENAQFLDPHVSVGWIPLGETFATATRMPYGLAMRMALMGTSERMSAQRAYEVGFVSEVVPADKLMERATEIAEVIAGQGPLAVRAIKETMNRMFHVTPYAESQEKASILHTTVNKAPDGIEGPRAFAQKRKPQWTGKSA